MRGERGAHERGGEVGEATGVQVRQDPLGHGEQASHVLLVRVAPGKATVHVPVQHHQGDGIAGDVGAHLAAGQQRAEHAETGPGDQLQQHTEAVEIERRITEEAFPPGIQEAARLRGRHRGQIRASHHLPERPGVRKELHVHHHARRRARASSAASHRFI